MDDADAVLLQCLLAGQTVRQVHHILLGAEAHHVEEVPRQGDALPPLRQTRRRELLGVAGLCHLGWEATVQVGGLQDRVTGEGAVHAGGVDGAAGLALKVLIAADVVGVGMGVIDGTQFPAVAVQHLTHPSSGVLVVAAVNQAHFSLTQLHQTDLGRALDVVAVWGHWDQFIHKTTPLVHFFPLYHTLRLLVAPPPIRKYFSRPTTKSPPSVLK